MTQSEPLRAALATVGCRVNYSETDALRGELQAAGYRLVEIGQEADLYIINTCTVTHVADRKSRQLLRRAARRTGKALVVAVGCYADVAADVLAGIEGVDLVLGREEEHSLLDRVHAALQARGLQPPARPADDGRVLLPASPVRALIKVQDGCDNRCAYCIVSIARGPGRSRPAHEILEEVQQVERSGYREIILTGINLGAYHHGQVGDLAGLARLLLQATAIERIRFSSIEPQDFPLTLLDLWPEPRLCRHFHLPLQSGCDRTLARMGRKYRLEDYRSLLEQIQRSIPGVGLTTDIIVGFPGESEEDFGSSLEAVAELPLGDIHIFPFSPRPGTAAAQMPDRVPPVVRRERCTQMHRLARQMARSFRQALLGETLDVLWDGKCRQGWSGLSDNYLRVITRAEGPLLGRITPTRLAGLDGTTLWGDVLAEPSGPGATACSGEVDREGAALGFPSRRLPETGQIAGFVV